MIVNSIIEILFDFVIFDKYFICVHFVVLNKIFDDNFVDHFRNAKLNNNDHLFYFFEENFLQSIYTIDFL